jgi:hypothetical protein
MRPRLAIDAAHGPSWTMSKPQMWIVQKESSKFTWTLSIQRLREQLRIAQQVHLRRKEITIANLQSRVQELESSIEKLSQSILSFSDLLFEADGLKKHPHVTPAFGTRRLV